MPHDEGKALRALHASSLDEGRIAYGKRLRTGDARKLRPADGTQGDNRVLDAAAKNTGNCQGEHKTGKCEEHIGSAHEQRVERACPPTGDHSHGRTNHRDHRNAHERGGDGRLASHDDARKHVAPIAVGAQKVRFARSLQSLAQILRIGVVGAKMLGKESGEHEQRREHGKDRQLARSGTGGTAHAFTSCCATRGSSARYRMSLTRLTRT